MADYIKKTHEAWISLEPKHMKSRYKGLTQDEIAQIRFESPVRRFPNYVGGLLSQFKGFNIKNCKDKWEILEER